MPSDDFSIPDVKPLAEGFVRFTATRQVGRHTISTVADVPESIVDEFFDPDAAPGSSIFDDLVRPFEIAKTQGPDAARDAGWEKP